LAFAGVFFCAMKKLTFFFFALNWHKFCYLKTGEKNDDFKK